MKQFSIAMPLTGIAYKVVEAETEDDAISIFLNEVTLEDVEEWECVQNIVKGNVFYGMLNEVEIEEQDY